MPLATTFTTRDGNNAAAPFGSMQDLAGNNAATVSLDSGRQVYRFSASFTPQATAAVTVISIQGSATKTVRVKRITVGGVATALADTLFILQRTSALGAGGTTVNPTAAKNDNSSAAATAVVAHYTATLKAAGTGVGGPLSTFRLFQDTTGVPTVASREPVVVFPERGAAIGQSLVLRGTSDFLEIQNANAGNLAAGSVLDYTIELEEDAS
jgi:hypothetical protein